MYLNVVDGLLCTAITYEFLLISGFRNVIRVKIVTLHSVPLSINVSGTPSVSMQPDMNDGINYTLLKGFINGRMSRTGLSNTVELFHFHLFFMCLTYF